MKNETQNNTFLNSFKLELEFRIETEQEILNELQEKKLSEYSITFEAKEFIMVREKIRNFNALLFNLEESCIDHDDKLKRFLIGMLRQFITLGKSYTHNSTCPFNNAINFARNEATLETMSFIQKYI
jgi:hypothetical protein